MNRAVATISTVAWLAVLSATGASDSGPQENGNKFALGYSEASAAKKREIRATATEKLCFFRYLRIVGIERGERAGQPYIQLQTVEPSSDMRVVFTVEKAVSLQKVESLETNDAVAVSGRIKSIEDEPLGIVLGPVIVRYKDRLQPTAGKELLPEVDPSARTGTDTSSGQDVVIKARK